MIRRSPLAVALACAGLAGCQPADTGQSEEPAGAEEMPPAPYVVDITARDYAFVGPAEIPSGWVTFRLRNEGMEHHFLLLYRVPEGTTLEKYLDELAAPFDSAWHGLRDGILDKAQAGALLGELLPAWFAEVRPMGGPGLVAAGVTAQTTVNLEPGSYMMECYVKSPEGEFHGVLGMTRPLTVTGESSGAEPPEADIEMTLTNSGMHVEGTPAAGEQVVAVHFQEHPEIGLGNDVHLARLADDTNLDDVVQWMDWMNVEGLGYPAPVEFVGGTHEAPGGTTVYLTISLEPGRYAWIPESPAAGELLQEFTVQ